MMEIKCSRIAVVPVLTSGGAERVGVEPPTHRRESRKAECGQVGPEQAIEIHRRLLQSGFLAEIGSQRPGSPRFQIIQPECVKCPSDFVSDIHDCRSGDCPISNFK